MKKGAKDLGEKKQKGICLKKIRYKTGDKNINGDEAREGSWGKVKCNHLENFWQVDERMRQRIMSRCKWKRKRRVALGRGVLVISVSACNGIFHPNHWDQARWAPISHDGISHCYYLHWSRFFLHLFDFGFDLKKIPTVEKLNGWLE